ncbi:MAG: HDOD domain-containing protein [Gammaproteobacteria bacterium]|nr:HDOD domain-containing protein [Gammaproteobacteria bacterium]MDH3857310.1 HDOD domain-containing protein [Gammaproteobacteria bacterium]
MSDQWDKVTIQANLITLPDIYWRLKEILDSHDYSMQDVAQLIVYDPGLTARLLRIVNSAYFGFAAKIDTVNHAVSILGVQQIRDLVLATSIADALGDYECEHLDIRQFWMRSVYRAIAARNLAGVCSLMDGERMFVAGLLSGIGHLIIYQSIPVLAQQAQREAKESGKALYLVEHDVIGFDHTRVASVLMKNWNLPDSLVTVVENHLEPDPDAEYLLDTAIVHVAAKMADAFSEDRPLDEALVETNRHAWDATGLDIAGCEAVGVEVANQLINVVNMLFPKLQRAVG